MKQKQICDASGTVVYWISEVMDAEKTTLVFLHGLTADHTIFEAQIPYFEKDCNLIVWDAPAHGLSRPYRSFTFEKAANALKAVLDDAGVREAVLIGQSMGGMIAQSFMLRYPSYAQGFIAVDSTPFGDYYSASDRWWLRQLEWMAKMYPLKLLKSSMAKIPAQSEAGRRNMEQMLSGYSKQELCHLMGIGFAGFLEDSRPMEIPCPVLLLIGENDRTGKVSSYNREWAERTGYPLIIIPDASHNSNVDNPAEVNRQMETFLQKIKEDSCRTVGERTA